jgi:hypothetical protein
LQFIDIANKLKNNANHHQKSVVIIIYLSKYIHNQMLAMYIYLRVMPFHICNTLFALIDRQLRYTLTDYLRFVGNILQQADRQAPI